MTFFSPTSSPALPLFTGNKSQELHIPYTSGLHCCQTATQRKPLWVLPIVNLAYSARNLLQMCQGVTRFKLSSSFLSFRPQSFSLIFCLYLCQELYFVPQKQELHVVHILPHCYWGRQLTDMAALDVRDAGAFMWQKCDYLTHWLSPWRRVFLEKLAVPQLAKKFPAFCGIPKFIGAHNSRPLVPVLGLINPVHEFLHCFFKIHSNNILPSMRRSSEMPTKWCVFPFPPHVQHALPISSSLIDYPNMRPICSSETSVSNHPTPCNNPEHGRIVPE
jgi:hypothetical protein